MNPRAKKILHLAVPIVGAMLAQNIMGLADTAMVGTLGPHALAAVGLGAIAAYFALAAFTGLSSSVQAIVSRRTGEGDAEIDEPRQAGMWLAVVGGTAVAALAFLSAPVIFPHLHADADVVGAGVPYLQARLLSVPLIGINCAFEGYFNGMSRPRVYLRALIATQLANLAISYVLVFGAFGLPALGTLGAGIGTAAATAFGTVIYAWELRRSSDAELLGRPAGAMFRIVLRQAGPSAVRSLVFAAGIMTLFQVVGSLGTHALAAANILINLTLVALLPAVGLGMAAATLVGSALGRGDENDAMRWGWEVSKLGVVGLVVVGLPMLIAPDAVLSLFVDDAATTAIAREPLRWIGATVWVDAFGVVLPQAMLGAGDSRRVMTFAVGMQWFIMLPLAYLIGPVLGLGLLGVWAAFIGHRCLQASVFAGLWRNGAWATAKL